MTHVELSPGTLNSRVGLWRHCGGMLCTCPGRLEVSRGSTESNHVTSKRHWSSVRQSELMSTEIDSGQNHDPSSETVAAVTLEFPK